jgi:hypothetical protein
LSFHRACLPACCCLRRPRQHSSRRQHSSHHSWKQRDGAPPPLPGSRFTPGSCALVGDDERCCLPLLVLTCDCVLHVPLSS